MQENQKKKGKSSNREVTGRKTHARETSTPLPKTMVEATRKSKGNGQSVGARALGNPVHINTIAKNLNKKFTIDSPEVKREMDSSSNIKSLITK